MDNPIGNVRTIRIEDEMRGSYLDYAMSVIVARALPDVRDGLKPVHRRILYAMDELGMRPNAAYKKSARLVGEVLGKYHPHGDSAVYDAMVRMAQDFSMRYPLVDGQGNFGSVDNDPPAAMRYCVTGETLVVTERGLERIDQLSPAGGEDISMRVLSLRGHVNSVSKWFACGEHPTRRVRTRRGYEVTGTTNHPLLVCVPGPEKEPAFAWKTIDQIAPGDWLVLDRGGTFWPEEQVDLRPYVPAIPATSRTERHVLPESLDEDLALLLGALTAEGTCRPRVIEFTNTLGEFADVFRATWERVFPTCRLHAFLREPTSYGKKQYWQLQVVSQQVIGFLNNLGLRGKSADRAIPEVVLRSPRCVAAAFLRGLFEGDGSVERSGRSLLRVSLCAKNRALLRDVQTLLLRFGIASTLNHESARGTYRLLIVGRVDLQLFADLIGFVSETKQAALNDVLALHTGRALPRTDVMPFVAEYLRANAGRGQREWLAKHNVDRPGRLAVALPRLAPVLPARAVAHLEHLIQARYLYEQVVAVEDAGPRPVYSIRVDSECHSFVANGFINHNTEARLAAIAEESLADLEKNTVDFTPNFDGTLREPVVMPSRLPNLLLNGSSGIAVGMATNIPPHNLNEICDALIHLIDHPDATIEDLMQFVKGPDFPTSGFIFGREGIVNAYTTGHGRVVIRAKAAIEEMPRGGRFHIVVTELPFQVNKAALVEKIAELVKDRKLEGISDLRDESDRQGMRVVIELRRDAQPQQVLNNLYKHTAMQTAFSCNMLALVDGQPRVLTLRMALQQFVNHRQVVITRRTEFELGKARERAHILEGLKIALDHLDEVIRTIRESESAEAARGRLMDGFGLSEVQAQAILDMQLRRLAALERQKILDELAEVLKLIGELEALLADPKKILKVVKDDLKDLKKKYGDARRTQIEEREASDFRKEDLIPDEPVAVTISFKGYIKRLALDTFRTQSRGGKGIRGVITREADAIQQILVAQTHDQLLFFTNRGRVFPLRGWDIPEAPSRQSKGLPVINLIPIDQSERVTAMTSIPKDSAGACFFFATKKGEVKRVAAENFMNVRTSGILAMDLADGDELCWVARTSGADDIIMVSELGQSIRFVETDVRLSNRASGGVRGMRFVEGDQLAGMDVVVEDGCMLMITSSGIGKRTKLTEYPIQGRGGIGVLTLPKQRGSGPVVAAKVVRENFQLLLISREGTVIRQKADEISLQKRPARGVNVMRVDDGDQVASITCFPIEGDDGE